MHDESLALHGGASGIRDEGLLDSALNRAPNLAKNHAFIDGNKRVAFLSVGLFLMLNGYKLTATQVDATLAIMAISANDMDEAQFADWIRNNSALR